MTGLDDIAAFIGATGPVIVEKFKQNLLLRIKETALK